MFITFEGPEGSGKSTQARLLAERLRAVGREVVETREPGGTPLGSQLRELVLGPHDRQLNPRSEALIMCAARAQLVDHVIRPALARGGVVICDRFGDSTLAYQGYGRGLDLDCLRAVVSFATANLEPEMTMLLDLPVDAGLARKQAQADWNRFEAEALAFHERVRRGYRALAAADPSRWTCLDGLRSPHELAADIWSRVAARIGEA